MVRSKQGLRLDNIPTNQINLRIEVTDGAASDFASVRISVRDVNDQPPTFEKAEYTATVPEDSLPGKEI